MHILCTHSDDLKIENWKKELHYFFFKWKTVSLSKNSLIFIFQNRKKMNDPKAFCGLNMPDYALILIIQKLKMEKNKLIFHFLKKWKMLFVKNKLIFIFQNRKKMNDPKTHGLAYSGWCYLISKWRVFIFVRRRTENTNAICEKTAACGSTERQLFGFEFSVFENVSYRENISVPRHA
jgi:hypothetical protein